LGNLIFTCRRLKRIHSKWIKDFKVNKNLGKTLENIGIGNIFLNSTPVSQEIRARIDKWDCIKLKCLHTSKEKITRMKRQSMEWKKILPDIIG
jgi:hypothetical protein